MGPTREECVAEAVHGLVDSFAVVAGRPPHAWAERHVTARCDEELLVAVIEEVIYWLDAGGEIPLSVAVRPAPDGGIVAFLVLARAADAEIIGAAPKAASSRGLRCAPDPAGPSHTEPLPTSVTITRTAKNASSARERSTPATAVQASVKPLSADSPNLGITSTMPRITGPYSTAPMTPDHAVQPVTQAVKRIGAATELHGCGGASGRTSQHCGLRTGHGWLARIRAAAPPRVRPAAGWDRSTTARSAY